MGACRILDRRGVRGRAQCASAAHPCRFAHRCSAEHRGRLVSGDVPQSHGLARSARRIDGRGLRRGAGALPVAELLRRHAQCVLFWPGRGTARLSHQPKKPHGFHALHGARGHDDLFAFHLRHVADQARGGHGKSAARHHLLADGLSHEHPRTRCALCRAPHPAGTRSAAASALAHQFADAQRGRGAQHGR